MGVNEDDHLTLLKPEGSIDKNVGPPLQEKEGRENDRTVNINVEWSGELNMCHLFVGVKLVLLSMIICLGVASYP